MLELSIDNRELFYLKGRKYNMKSYRRSYYESNIVKANIKII